MTKKSSGQLTLTSSLEVLPASLSLSEENDLHWVTSVVTWPLSFLKLWEKRNPDGLSGKTSLGSLRPLQERTVVLKEQTEKTRNAKRWKRRILEPSSLRYKNTGLGTHGEFWMLSSSESPNNAVVCSLLAILEGIGAHLLPYYLTPKH